MEVKVRYKRCPLCGTIVLMSTAMCPICDRHFQTTATFAKRIPAEIAIGGAWATAAPSPYAYHSSANTDNFYVNTPKKTFKRDEKSVQVGPIVAAVFGLSWLGMMMNHQFAKGLLVLLLHLLFAAVVVIVGVHTPYLLLTDVLIGVCGYVIGVADVIGVANRYARGEDVRDWDWF